MRILLLAVIAAASLCAQAPLLNRAELLSVCADAVQRMEAAGFAAGAPLLETARQTLAALRLNASGAEVNYKFLSNLRAYVQLADAVAKPFPLPDETRRQFDALRADLARMDAHFLALLTTKDTQLRNPDPDNFGRYADADSRLSPPQPDRPRVVFLGDSITDAWPLNEYFPGREFVNRGISGQITSQMLARMEPDVVRLQPAAMLVLGGANDIARGIALSTIEDNLTAIAELAGLHHIQVILASVLPVSDYHKNDDPNFEMTRTRPPATIRALNEWIRNFCASRNLIYLDYWPDLADEAGFLKADLAADGLHPNAAGYRAMAPLALKAIDAALAAPTNPRPRKRRLFPKAGAAQMGQ